MCATVDSQCLEYLEYITLSAYKKNGKRPSSQALPSICNLEKAKAWGVWIPKGQLISKCLFCIFNIPKQWTKTIRLEVTIVVKSNFFVRSLGELKIPKRHFEINWPLESYDCIACFYELLKNVLPVSFFQKKAFSNPFIMVLLFRI